METQQRTKGYCAQKARDSADSAHHRPSNLALELWWPAFLLGKPHPRKHAHAFQVTSGVGGCPSPLSGLESLESSGGRPGQRTPISPRAPCSRLQPAPGGGGDYSAGREVLLRAGSPVLCCCDKKEQPSLQLKSEQSKRRRGSPQLGFTLSLPLGPGKAHSLEKWGAERVGEVSPHSHHCTLWLVLNVAIFTSCKTNVSEEKQYL